MKRRLASGVEIPDPLGPYCVNAPLFELLEYGDVPDVLNPMIPWQLRADAWLHRAVCQRADSFYPTGDSW